MPDRPSILGSAMIPRKGMGASDGDQGTPASQPAQSGGRAPIEPVQPTPLRRSMTYRPTVEMHDWLKMLSHSTGHSIQDLIDEALRRLREDHDTKGTR